MREVMLTEGSIFGGLLRFSLPMIGGNLLQQVYNLTDTLIVGRYLGSDALGAVGSVYTLMTFLTSILIGLCMGSGAFFSADYGAREQDRLREDIRLSFRFIFVVSVLISAAVYPATGLILSLLRTPPELMDMTKSYVSVAFGGLMFLFLYNFFAYLLRAMGNSVVPLIFLGVSTVMNIGLDIWFVVGLELGVAGAAWATVLAQAAAGIGIALYVLGKIPLLRTPMPEAPTPGRLRQIIAGDVATGIQQSVMNFGILMIQGLVNSFGAVIMAAFAAAVKIDTIAYMPAQEFGNAYSLFVSQNSGAGKPERVKQGTKVAFGTATGFCLVSSAVIFAFAGALMGLFLAPGETEILAEGVRYLRIEGAMYVGIGILFLWYGYFRGIGKPRVSLLLTVISLGTRVVLAYALAPRTPLGVTAIWLAIPIGWGLADLAGLALYRKQDGGKP